MVICQSYYNSPVRGSRNKGLILSPLPQMFHVHYVTIPKHCDNLRLKFAHPAAVGHECPSMSSDVFSKNSKLLNVVMLLMKIGSRVERRVRIASVKIDNRTTSLIFNFTAY